MGANPPDGIERREFYRVDDYIIFDYQIIKNGKVPRLDPEKEPTVLLSNLINEKEKISNQSNMMLHQINTRQPQLAEALRCIEKKIDMLYQFLSQDLIAKFLLKADQRKLEYVNLSAGGMSFEDKHALEKNTPLLLKLIMPPHFDCVVTQATVVHCKTIGKEKFQIAVQFKELSEEDEQKIVHHVFQREIEENQARLRKK